jgi:D-cysteine desulfhydrase
MRLGAHLGLDLFFKRDDLSGALYGGGKTRKLEFFLADARAKGAKRIVTFGGVGSNQAVATALFGASLGFQVKLSLAPQMPSEYVRNNLLAARRAGAEIELATAGVAKAEEAVRRAVERESARITYLVPPGGSSPLGNLAFVSAALELCEQIAGGRAPVPDRIYIAMGTMGSAVGLALGLEMAGIRSEVVAVRASSPETSSRARFFAMAKETVAFAKTLDSSFPDVKLGHARVRFSENHLGKGYGRATKEGLAAMELAMKTEGHALEPTYTAKAMAALVADAEGLEGKTVVFWNSHNARPLVTEGVDPRTFPATLRHYVETDGAPIP